MTPSNVCTLFAFALLTSVVFMLAYIQSPWTPRRVERQVKQWVSPTLLVGYMMVVIAAFLAAVGQ